MKKRFESFISFLLLFFILLVFIGPLVINFTSIDENLLNRIWDISFLISWALMLVYPLYILFEKNSRSYSIFASLITSLCFIALSYHGLLTLVTYVDFLPQFVAVPEKLARIWQQLLYTGLILVYIVHVINLLNVSRKKS